MSLTIRLVLLCALVVMLAVAVSALAAMRAVTVVLDSQERIIGERAAAEFLRHAGTQIGALAQEAAQLGQRDTLYTIAPRPAVAWARQNLIPPTIVDRLSQHIIIVDQGEVIGRYSSGRARGPQPNSDDPAPGKELLALLDAPKAAGLAWLDGHPALWARQPILPAEGGGEPRGTLLALAYLTPRTVERLAIHGWDWRLLGPDEPPPDPDPTRDDQIVRLGPDAPGLAVVLSRPRTAEAALAGRTLRAIALAGTAVGVLAVIIGVLLGTHWLRPLTDLAAACRRRVQGIDTPIPDGGDLPETRVLAEDLRRLIEIERQHRERLAGELAQAEDASTRQRAWLIRLAHDVGSPVQAVAAAVRQLEERGGLLPPGELPALRAAVDQLLGRVEDAVGLAEAQVPERPAGGPAPLPGYAEAVLGLLRARAEARGVRLAAEVAGAAALDASLLTPLLVNLLANAIAASPAGGEVRLAGGVEARQVWWQVADAGPGMAPEQRERVARAFARGEVAPGEPGFGLGLTVAIANAARLGGRLRLLDGPGTQVRVELPV